MKIVQLALLLIFCLPLMALMNLNCDFLSLEPSAINLAMGGKAVSCVNIWHNSPLTSYSNPSLAAYHTGISYGYAERELVENENLGTDYYSSLVNINLGSFSLTLPAYRLSEMSGVHFDYKPVFTHDPQGNVTKETKIYEKAAVYGVAFDVLDLEDSVWIPDCIYDNMSIAVGINYLDVSSHIIPSSVYYNTRHADSWDFGTAVRYTYDWSDATELEFVGAYSHNNVYDCCIRYASYYQIPLWEGESKGVAVALHGKADAILKDKVSPERIFFDNLYSIRFMNAAISESKGNSIGWGVELGLLDTFFVRKGRYSSNSGAPRGESFGLGINLHYRDLLSLSCNYAKYPEAGDPKEQEAEDINLSFDLNTLARHFAKWER